MPKRKPVETSLAAYRGLDPVRLSQLHQDIIRAVGALQEANYEAIADFLMLKPEKVWKRLNEVERAGAIYKPGNTVLTRNRAKSYTYRLTQPGQSNEPVIEKSLPGESVADFSRKLIGKQPELF